MLKYIADLQRRPCSLTSYEIRIYSMAWFFYVRFYLVKCQVISQGNFNEIAIFIPTIVFVLTFSTHFTIAVSTNPARCGGSRAGQVRSPTSVEGVETPDRQLQPSRGCLQDCHSEDIQKNGYLANSSG